MVNTNGKSIINVALERLENLKAQFEGTAEKSTLSNPPVGGFGGGFPGGFGGGFPGGDFDGQMQRPENSSRPSTGQSQNQPQSMVDTSSLIMIGVSVLVLALGLVFAFTFKRRK